MTFRTGFSDTRSSANDCRATVEYIRVDSSFADLRPVLATLRDSYGIRSVLCEGGPTLNAASCVLRDRLVDELFLSLAAKLSGEPDGFGIVAALPRGATTDLVLRWAPRSGDDLFLRYTFPSPRQEPPITRKYPGCQPVVP